uniref:Uncharacterized protein n=1 Tax=Oryza meridionalis TaxID=40149 RepID=A0A0E0EKU1_9ORYZ
MAHCRGLRQRPALRAPVAAPPVPRHIVLLQPLLRLSGFTRHLSLLEGVWDTCLCGAHDGGWVTVAVDPCAVARIRGRPSTSSPA